MTKTEEKKRGKMLMDLNLVMMTQVLLLMVVILMLDGGDKGG